MCFFFINHELILYTCIGFNKDYIFFPIFIRVKLNDFNKYSSFTTQLEEMNLAKWTMCKI